jgi:anti-sigma factor ChrR (cupin superfamily)
MSACDLRLRLHGGEPSWRATRYPGVFWVPLEIASADGMQDSAALIRMDPACGYPAHRHVGVEDVLVLQGGYRDELGVHGAGSFIRYAAGSRHAPIALGDAARPVNEENPACVLFAIARGGVELEGAPRT